MLKKLFLMVTISESKKELEFHCQAIIDNLDVGSAKTLFEQLLDIYGEKYIHAECNLKNNLSILDSAPNSVNELFTKYSKIDPIYSDLSISIEHVGRSELDGSFTRIGYSIGWSEVVCRKGDDRIYIFYPDDSHPGKNIEAEEAHTSIWHNLLSDLSIHKPIRNYLMSKNEDA